MKPDASSPQLPTVTPHLLLPYGVDGAPEHASIPAILDHHERQQVRGLVVGAVSGDMNARETAARGRLLRSVAAQALNRFWLIADVNAPDSAQILTLARDAAAAGYGAVSLFTPIGLRSNAQEARELLLAVAAETALPIHLSAPCPTQGGPRPSELLRLCDVARATAVTLYSRDIAHIERISYRQPGLSLYCGFEEVLLPALSVGATGVSGPLAGVLAPLLHELHAAFLAGETVRALAVQRHIGNFVSVAADIGAIAASRGWMTLMGIASGPCRGDDGCLTPVEWRALQRCLDRLAERAEAA